MRTPERAKALRVWFYIVAVVAGAAAASSVVIADHHGPVLPHHVAWPLLTVGFVATSAFPMKFHVRRQTVEVDLVGLAVVIAAVTASSSSVLLAVLCAGLTRVRQYQWRLDRTLFNVASQVFAVAIGLGLLDTLLKAASSLGPRTWPALMLLPIVYELVTGLLVFGIVGISGGSPGWAYIRTYLTGLSLVLPLNAALGIVAATVAWTQPFALLLLLGPGVLVAAWYRRADKIKNRYSDLQKLYEFTVKLSEQSEGSELIRAALEEARHLLHALSVVVYLPGKSGMVRYQLDGDGQVAASRQELPQSLKKVVQDEESILVPRGKHPALLADTGLADLIASPVDVGADRPGVLVIGEREGSQATFDNDDLLLLEALAANMGTALTSVRRHDALQEARIRREYDLRHDDLTGLPNRSEFSSQLSGALARRQPSELMAVVLMDLDGFKEINDTLGHDAGDQLLRTVSQRLAGACADAHAVIRLGGDEFV
ncbi:MAG TPA: GGDEF domain-containing protein, partial [Acidimicrobiales bacterium]|nr:GGDEF domain-containing protein [Acidimicrobiales bacterium]